MGMFGDELKRGGWDCVRSRGETSSLVIRGSWIKTNLGLGLSTTSRVHCLSDRGTGINYIISLSFRVLELRYALPSDGLLMEYGFDAHGLRRTADLEPGLC